MLSVEITDILKRYVAELVRAMPPNWESVAVYTEFLRSAGQGSPDCADVGMYVVGGKLIRNFRTSLPAHMAIEEFFLACEGGEGAWAGIRVEVFNSGKYKSNYYYGSTPLLDGNLSEVDKRIGGVG